MEAINCNACGKTIGTPDISLECSGCHEPFDLECVNISQATFEAFSQEAKDNWTCPICISARPKGGNLNTPIRTSIEGWNTTYVSESSMAITDLTAMDIGNVNSIRGDRGGSLKNDSLTQLHDNLLDGNLSDLLLGIQNELQILRTQNKEILPLRQDVQRLTNVVKDMAESINELKKSLEDRDRYIVDIESRVSQSNILSNKTYADTIVKSKKDNITRPNILPKQPVSVSLDIEPKSLGQSAKTQSGQREPSNRPSFSAVLSSRGNNVAGSSNDAAASKQTGSGTTECRQKGSADEGWHLVQNSRKRSSFTEVKKGGNTSSNLKGTERRKYLHVWRLHKTTTEEELTEFVVSVVQNEVKINKIKTKTERDYASFIIGVPESSYNKLCQSEVWPVNVEFAEWIWFRKERPSNGPSEAKL
ncbi:hypothetical protein JYU34_002937 [Plutella xylostella]|uniref:PHD-type domain-containing protein n=1 Tax=Plutella xylostella TaxID=51655 RepID=A0ABQ7R3L5_PLUXY|nr:hypothetical protein JYU34_004021 [Plutella xylostella]KAG7311853.1 hypothetical protein JYU34_002937 [Plutella xylostella]